MNKYFNQEIKYKKTISLFFVFCLNLFLMSCQTTYDYYAVSGKTGEQYYYKLGNNYKVLLVNKDATKLYYFDENGKTKIYVNPYDSNVVTETERWKQEQGNMNIAVTPNEIYEESSGNIFTITIDYNLNIQEAELVVYLKSGKNNIQTVEKKVIHQGNDIIKYTIQADIDIVSPYIIYAHFKEKNGNRVFAENQKTITVKEPIYMTKPINNIREMQEIKQKNITLGSRRAENDFNNYGASYAIPYLNLRELLVSISSGSLQQIFASNYPLPLSRDLQRQIEDWQYISRKQFENAVYILAYMETVDRLQRRSRY